MIRTTPPVSVYGVPTDIGASRRGASMGPEAMRVAGLVEAISARGIDVRDIGDVQGPRNPVSAPVDGYRHLDEVAAWNRAVFDMSTRELQAGRLPIMLGGDHCLGIGAIAAVAAHCRATWGIVWASDMLSNLEQARRAHATRDAHGNDDIARAAPFALDQRMADKAAARHAERVAQSNRAAGDVQ